MTVILLSLTAASDFGDGSTLLGVLPMTPLLARQYLNRLEIAHRLREAEGNDFSAIRFYEWGLRAYNYTNPFEDQPGLEELAEEFDSYGAVIIEGVHESAGDHNVLRRTWGKRVSTLVLHQPQRGTGYVYFGGDRDYGWIRWEFDEKYSGRVYSGGSATAAELEPIAALLEWPPEFQPLLQLAGIFRAACGAPSTPLDRSITRPNRNGGVDIMLEIACDRVTFEQARQRALALRPEIPCTVVRFGDGLRAVCVDNRLLVTRREPQPVEVYAGEEPPPPPAPTPRRKKAPRRRRI